PSRMPISASVWTSFRLPVSTNSFIENPRYSRSLIFDFRFLKEAYVPNQRSKISDQKSPCRFLYPDRFPAHVRQRHAIVDRQDRIDIARSRLHVAIGVARIRNR